MSIALVPLAVVMWLVTYPSRAVGLLAPSIERLPRRVLRYLQLVGPAVLAALAAVNTVTAQTSDGATVLSVGVAWLAVPACIVVVAWRQSLFLGLLVAVAITFVGRALGAA
jgi:branched-subunit amino acid transport protein